MFLDKSLKFVKFILGVVCGKYGTWFFFLRQEKRRNVGICKQVLKRIFEPRGCTAGNGGNYVVRSFIICILPVGCRWREVYNMHEGNKQFLQLFLENGVGRCFMKDVRIAGWTVLSELFAAVHIETR